MEGWIKLHRQLSDNPMWLCDKFTRGQAWIDLLILANHKEGYFYTRGVKVIVKRGQVGWSEVKLSERWKWSRSKTRKFLNDLEKEQQIEQQKNNVSLLLTIINYDKFQKNEQQTEQQKDSRKTAERQQKDTNKKEKNNNNKKNVKKEELNLDFISEFNLNGQTDRFTEIFKYFIAFRAELKKPFKTDRGLKQCFNQLLKLSNSNVEIAGEILQRSISNEWQGLFALPEKKKNNTSKHNPEGARTALDFVKDLETSGFLPPDEILK